MKERIIILGAAESGVGAALLAQREGYDVFVSDAGRIPDHFKNELALHQIPFEELGHTEEKIFTSSLIIKSPGIPGQSDTIRRLRDRGAQIISEIEFAYRHKGDSKIIAVTGSNGKTTCTTMIFQMLQAEGMDVAAVGNIGFSFARQIATDPKQYYVAEVSSFQLDDITSFRPDVAVLTNITEDHLDRYDYQIGNYIKSKFNIIRYQTSEDLFIYNQDDEITMKNIDKYLNNVKTFPVSMRKILLEGAFVSNHELHVKFRDEEITMSVEDFALKGKHNIYNSMAAASAAGAVGVRKMNIRESLTNIKDLEHRTQFVASVGGVDFINDSKATNVNSTWYALESMEKPVVLILGGVDKGNDYRILYELVEQKVHAIVCLGVDNEKIHEAFASHTKHIVDASGAEEAVQKAYQLANKGDVVLLSPACASFDLFKNYEDRGEQFMKAVKNL